MIEFHIAEATRFYDEHIFRKDRFEIYTLYGFSITGSIPSIDWEVFGAIITGNKNRAGYGSDLSNIEVKSAVSGSSFEYQYHRLHGEEKLNEDEIIGHLFISYSSDYRSVCVRYVAPGIFSSIFESWREGYKSQYAQEKQRYRKSISYGLVCTHGQIILEIKNYAEENDQINRLSD
jgi:hypothetical protein